MKRDEHPRRLCRDRPRCAVQGLSGASAEMGIITQLQVFSNCWRVTELLGAVWVLFTLALFKVLLLAFFYLNFLVSSLTLVLKYTELCTWI